MVSVLDKNYFRYSGRILEKDNSAYLGFTNSKVEFFMKGNSSKNCGVAAHIETKQNGEENEARLKVFIDESDVPAAILILHEESKDYLIFTFDDNEIHKITIIKITEAAMSYAKLTSVTISEGELISLPPLEEKKLKVEFIGDSITCGYGVYGDPESEYHIKDEDGMVTYAALAANVLDLDARYTCVSGYGMYIKYDGDLEGTLPKIYPYTNFFVDEKEKYDFSEFIPDLFVINLGTNDCNHLNKEEVQKGFVSTYVDFLKLLKSYAPKSKILCVCGTLCTSAFNYIDSAVKLAKESGLTDLYSYEFPFMDIEKDGIASGHPSLITHRKDAQRLVVKIKEIMGIE